MKKGPCLIKGRKGGGEDSKITENEMQVIWNREEKKLALSILSVEEILTQMWILFEGKKNSFKWIQWLTEANKTMGRKGTKLKH